MKILITAFEPFGGDLSNPTMEVLNALPNTLNNNTIFKLILPTVFDESINRLNRTLDELQPDIIISLGLSANSSTLTLERIALNLDDARIPDNTGFQPSERTIFEDGPLALKSSLPLNSIYKKLIENKIPVITSTSAGTYVCNHVFYGALYYCQNYLPKSITGFIHIPYLPAQVVTHNKPSMALELIVEGLLIILDVCLKELN